MQAESNERRRAEEKKEMEDESRLRAGGSTLVSRQYST
jgi:hypothetical protein